MASGVDVEQPANHFLVLGAMFFRFVFEKIDAGFAQSDGHFDALLAECQFCGRRQKVLNDTKFT